MITPSEIDKILLKKKFKQRKQCFGFDSGIVGLGVGQKAMAKKKLKVVKK